GDGDPTPWRTASVVAVAPEAAVKAVACVAATSFPPPGEGDTVRFRRPILTRGSDPVDFFTGDSDDTARWTYEWSGTPGDSTSLKFDNDLTDLLSTDVDDSAITHTTDVPFNTVTVNNPLDVMVELIEVTEGESGEETSVAVTIRSTGSGTTVQRHTSGTVRTNGKGTYTASIMDGTLEVSGDAWTLSQPCTSTPSRVRITAMPDGHHYLGALNTGFALGAGDQIAVNDDHVFVLDYGNAHIYAYDLGGASETDWSLPESVMDIAVFNDELYAISPTGMVYQYDATGTQVETVDLNTSFSEPSSIAVG